MAVKANIGLGGNIGDPRAAMAAALRQLDAHAECGVTNVSRLYRTPPWGKTDQAWFFNAAAEIETSLAPEALLDLCLDIERGMKRERVVRWGPRTIDLDVLTYGDSEIRSDRLSVPHPHLHERAFVLMPLCDYAGDLVIANKTASAWLTSADTAGIEVADEDRQWWKAA
ncbi:2-amino-4-hydroxy-6-hydroxymethyldihydropteridine diphosphokinase [Rhizobium sp. L1K21]|uniref:2-amino-4-hydroxy-6- hydroxymethyldihydropteridine diphosphokinase n=1 Tax=Rhizobium sp. L1K21 TaxID=2954933 RepID=UPI003593987F